MLTKVLLHCSPKELNKIELTVKFWKEYAKVAGIFDDLFVTLRTSVWSDLELSSAKAVLLTLI